VILLQLLLPLRILRPINFINNNNNNNNCLAGCAFVTFFKRKDATAAQAAIHGAKTLPGVSLDIQLSCTLRFHLIKRA